MRALTAAAILVLSIGLAACGAATARDGDPDAPDSTGDPAAGACLEGEPDCVDTVEGEGDAFDENAERAYARSLLATAEGELSEFVRVGRRGEEHFMLTEDYVLGRHTVELDADGAGVYRVTKVTVELFDGPEIVTP